MKDTKLNKNKVILCSIFGILILGSQMADTVYISKHIDENHINYDINNNEIVNSYFDDSIYLVKTARGYYGIVNANGREVISPVWNSVEVLSENRFIVGRVLNSASVSVGILDDYENVVTPMLFSSISQENEYFRIGTLNENGKKIFFDSVGNIQLYQDWDSYELDNDTAKVKKDNITAIITADEDGRCSYSSLYIPSNIFDKDFSVTIKNPVSDGVSALDDYKNVVESLSTYCEAIFDSDTDSIRKITNSKYYNSLISNMLPDCQLNHISNVSVYGETSDDIDGAVLYHAEIKLAYASTTSIIEKHKTQEIDTILLKLEFVRDLDGSIVLRSAEKILADTDDGSTTETDAYSSTETEYQY
ncbi:MAG: hypothetical protein LIO71_02480 [Ruminococcus sp.]|nr:hypothetical protein [Ruminococcus sp.]